jgi:exodeoxyribonuclease VII large subunit
MTTYLVTTYKDKDQVKALGGRWDPVRRQWYVPKGRDLVAFAAWLPTDIAAESEPLFAAAPLAKSTTTELTLPKKGVPLSHLLNGVAQAVASVFASGVWTTVEVVDVRIRGGHVYLEVSERDASGVITAKANAVIWATVAQRILPAFEQATGAQLGPGIKLLVRARPVFKAQYGFSLEVDAIDSDYTLGDLEARKREIRERLQREGLFDLNKQLPQPWDYQHVLVVAPEGGAGLGDFQAEAARLESYKICQFTYAFSRFQGEGAATEIQHQMHSALEQIKANHPWVPDALVIIRGGGAVNDMAWLNDYSLVRAVCELGIPVLTGIGHERDNTVLDEVANIRFDTPSKVILGIERTILQRVREAQGMFELITRTVGRSVEVARRAVVHTFSAVESGSRQELVDTRQRASELQAQVKLEAVYVVRGASDAVQRQMTEVRHLASQQLHQAKRDVPVLLSEIRAESRQSLRMARTEAQADVSFVLGQVASDLRHQKTEVKRTLTETVTLARKTVQEARLSTQALMREVAGQGPEKTLGRGFALVRDPDGKAITTAHSIQTNVIIQFRDGQRPAKLDHGDPQ